MTLSFSSKIFLFWFHPLPMLCQTISMPSEVNAFLKNPNQPGAGLQIGTIMGIQIGGQILECIAACVGCINVVKCHNKNSSYFQINSNHVCNSNVPPISSFVLPIYFQVVHYVLQVASDIAGFLGTKHAMKNET